MYATISFYQYFLVDTPLALKEKMQKLCQQHQLKGRILIAEEGINAAVSGKKEDIEEFKKSISQKKFCGFFFKYFTNITFREQQSPRLAHHKLTVKVRKEIVRFGKKVDLKKRGDFLKPEELYMLYENENFFSENSQWVIIDARNDYEWKVGKFKNAITLPLKNFREFSEQAKELQKFKNKKMVLYCTGGIRCEKASAYLKEQGFSEVYQIEGGIINYLNFIEKKKQKYQNDKLQNFWEGGLFVFDDRLVSETGKSITVCAHCGKAAEKYQNCFNLNCDKLFVGCADCLQSMKNTCSEKCKEAPRKRKIHNHEKKEILGRVENYYAKKKVALIKVCGVLRKSQQLSFSGKTTNLFSQKITELKNEDGEEISCAQEGQLITLPVEEKVRKGDKVVAF